MRRVILSLRDTDPCSDQTWSKRVKFEECMGAYWYRETLHGTVRTLRSPSGPFSRQIYPTEPDKAGQQPFLSANLVIIDCSSCLPLVFMYRSLWHGSSIYRR